MAEDIATPDDASVSSISQSSSTSDVNPVSLSTVLMSNSLDYNRRTVPLIKPRKVTSSVWEYFGTYPSHIANRDGMVVCTLCRDAGKDPMKFEVKYGTTKSTSKMSNHLSSNHREEFLASVAQQKSKKRPYAGEVDAMIDFTKKCKKSKKDQVREAYLRWVVSDYVPLSQCDSQSFRDFMHVVDKSYENEDRKGVRSRLVCTAAQIRKILKRMVKGETIAITTDCWTSVSNKPYISLTGHFINEEWKLNSLVLCCDHFPGRHVADKIAEKVHSMCATFGIANDDVSCCITDNEPTMNATADYLAFGWMGCFDHLLELVTGAMFKSKSVVGVLKRCRQLVGHFSGSTQALEMLTAMQKTLNESCIPVTPDTDVMTRWWSTFLMLSKLLRLKPAIFALTASSKIPTYLAILDWDIIEVLTVLLKPFMRVQKFMEGDKYITVSFMPYLVSKIRSILKTMLEKYTVDTIQRVGHNLPQIECDHIRECIKEMTEVFNFRFGSGEPGTVYSERHTRGERRILKGLTHEAMVACYLDPRTKGSGIPEGEDMIRLRHLIYRMMEEEFDKINVDLTTNLTSDDSVERIEDSTSSSIGDVAAEELEEDDLWDDLAPQSNLQAGEETLAQQRCRILQAELSQFDKLPQVIVSKSTSSNDASQHHQDPLRWWKHHAFSMPYLSKVARCYLAIPATSASSERVFSIGGLTVTDKRSRLNADVVSDFVVLKGSWDKVSAWMAENNVSGDSDDEDTPGGVVASD
jgi:hypothetical protein